MRDFVRSLIGSWSGSASRDDRKNRRGRRLYERPVVKICGTLMCKREILGALERRAKNCFCATLAQVSQLSCGVTRVTVKESGKVPARLVIGRVRYERSK